MNYIILLLAGSVIPFLLSITSDHFKELYQEWLSTSETQKSPNRTGHTIKAAKRV